MQTESVDVIKYVFLLSAGLRPFILVVGGGGNPVFALGEFVRLWIGRVTISLEQSPLATSCGISMCRWTVCYVLYLPLVS